MRSTQGVGISGAHRVGKTTLARLFSETHGIPFVDTSSIRVWDSFGLKPSDAHPFGVRLLVQRAILEDCCSQWAMQDGAFITDRTPIDFLAYTYANIAGAISDEDRAELTEYERLCFAALSLYFRVLVVVQPGIPIVEAPGKAVTEPAYIEHLNHLMIGLMNDGRVKCANFYIRRQDTSLEVRMKALGYCQKVVDQQMLQIASNEREALGASMH